MRNQLSQEQLENQVNQFNEIYKEGDTVFVMKYADGSETFVDSISRPASIMGGHTAMAWLDNNGCYDLTFVKGKVKFTNFEDLKHDTKVWVYIPETELFYKMECYFTPDRKFRISNFCTRDLISGHEYMSDISDQEDLDAFFYIETKIPTLESFLKAEIHLTKNNKRWIF